jgi:chaperonin cofactor prefoldin
MTEQDILDQMKNIGVNVGNILSATSTSEAVLSGLLAKKDEMPEGMFKQLESSLRETREGRANMKSELANLEKTLKKNGNNNSK